MKNAKKLCRAAIALKGILKIILTSRKTLERSKNDLDFFFINFDVVIFHWMDLKNWSNFARTHNQQQLHEFKSMCAVACGGVIDEW